MKDGLTQGTRELIQLAQGFDDATSEDRQRVHARLVVALAAGAAVSTASTTSQASSGASWSGTQLALKNALTLKKFAALAAIAGAGAAAVLWATAEDETEAVRRGRAASQAKFVAPAMVPTVLAPIATPIEELPFEEHALEDPAAVELPVDSPPEQSVTVEMSDEPALKAARNPKPTVSSPRKRRTSRAVRTATSTPEPMPKISGTGQLSDELLQLAKIRTALGNGEAKRALKLLESFHGEFSTPVLGIEAAALRVDALCRAQQPKLARLEADSFLKQWPDSPLARGIALTCR